MYVATFRFLTTFGLLALLYGCVSGTKTGQSDARPELVGAPQEETEEKAPERPFPADSLYPLLVAEFALRRDSHALALKHYQEQSRILDDVGVHTHTTHVAQFMRDEDSILEAAELWVASEPDNVEVNAILANVLTRRGRPLEALPHLAAVGRGGGKAQYPVLLNGFRALDKSSQRKLIDGIDNLTLEFPDDIQLMLAQALVRGEQGQAEQALAILHDLFEQEPYQHQAVLLATKLQVEQGSEDPYARLRKALELTPDDKRLRLQYARLLTRTDLTEAQKQFEILSERSPRDGDILFSLALLNRETGNNEKAKAYLREMLSLGQRVNEGQYYLGRLAEESGDVTEALSHYKKVDSGGDFFSANSRIGDILIKAEKEDQMREYFVELRQKKKRLATQLYGLEIDLLAKAGHIASAMTLSNRALEELPDSTSLLYTRSILAEKQDDLAQMESDLLTIIALEPNNATALNALGYSLANRTQRYAQAHALITKALALQPEEPAILDSMGWVLFRRGNYEEALTFLTQAYRKYPDPEVAAHLGEVLWVVGETSRAIKIWREALLKNPGHEILRTTVKRLGATDIEVAQ